MDELKAEPEAFDPDAPIITDVWGLYRGVYLRCKTSGRVLVVALFPIYVVLVLIVFMGVAVFTAYYKVYWAIESFRTRKLTSDGKLRQSSGG
jgi:hypothetical protein